MKISELLSGSFRESKLKNSFKSSTISNTFERPFANTQFQTSARRIYDFSLLLSTTAPQTSYLFSEAIIKLKSKQNRRSIPTTASEHEKGWDEEEVEVEVDPNYQHQ